MTCAAGSSSRTRISGTASDVPFCLGLKVLTHSIPAHWCETRRAAAFVANSLTAGLAFIAGWNQLYEDEVSVEQTGRSQRLPRKSGRNLAQAFSFLLVKW